MTYHYTDPDGDQLHVEPVTRYGAPALNVRTVRQDGRGSAAVDIPVRDIEDVVDGLRAVRRQAVGAHPGNPATKPQPAAPGGSALRDPLAEAVRHYPGCTPLTDSACYRIADAVLAAILPTTRLTAALHRSAEEDIQRVIALHEQWVKAGPPPLGTSVARWWDARLVELRDAILPPDQQPTTEPGREAPE